MQLLNVGFVILCLRISFCVLPVAIGVFLIASGEEKKRDMRNWVCNRLFGMSNAIEYPKFARFLLIAGSAMVLFGLAASWFLLLRRYF